jgi:hypothetical protein
VRNVLLAAFAGIGLIIAIACGSGGGGTPARPTATEQAPPTRTPAATEGTPTAATGNEAGQPPIYWRTSDNFSSLQAGQSYKVLFRIAGGFAETTLRITAVCQSCATPGQKQPVVFEPARAQPGEGEAPGSYYPVGITLPFPGTWQITVVAGSDQAQITVEAAGAPAG